MIFFFFQKRFSKNENIHPLAFLSFGQGPRNCICNKFVLIFIKMLLIKTLRLYEIHATSKTPTSLDYIEGFIRVPKQAILIKIKKR